MKLFTEDELECLGAEDKELENDLRAMPDRLNEQGEDDE